MANWQTSRNYRKHKNADGTFTYTIMVDGEKVEVIREVYTTYAQSERQLEYIELSERSTAVPSHHPGDWLRCIRRYSFP